MPQDQLPSAKVVATPTPRPVHGAAEAVLHKTDPTLSKSPVRMSKRGTRAQAFIVKKRAEVAALRAQSEAPKPDATQAQAPATAAETPTPAPALDAKGADAAAPEHKTQFAALARAERRIRETEKQFEQERKAFADEREKFKQEAGEIMRLREVAQRDKYALVKEMGLDVEEWARRELGVDAAKKVEPSSEIDELREAVAAMRAEREAEKKQAEESTREAEHQRLVTSYKAEIGDYLKTNTMKYELTAAQPDPAAVVWKVIEHEYNNTKKVLTTEQACAILEKYLESELERYKPLSKIKQLFGQSVGGESTQSAGGKAKPLPSSAPDRVSGSRLTKDERRARAIALLTR